MARPKKGTPASDIATNKWRDTMLARYGSTEAWQQAMRERGAKGGRNGNTGGFASGKMCDCDLIAGRHKYSQCAGTIGGRISKKGSKNGQSN